MAISTPVNRGTASNTTSGQTLSVSPNATVAVGKTLIVVCVADNEGTTNVNEAANEHTVYDSVGNVYRKAWDSRRGAGAANAGVTLSVYVTTVEVQLTTADSVTFRITSARTAKGIGLIETGGSAGNTLILHAATAANGASTAPSAALSSLGTRAHLFLGIVGVQGPTSDGFTQDADYTTLSNPGTTGGTATNNVNARVAYRIATLAGDTYNPTLGTSRDWTCQLLAFREVPLASLPIDDTYATDASAGAVIESSSPSGHTRYGVDSGSRLSIDNGALRMGVSDPNDWKSAGLVYGPVQRSAGRAVAAHLRYHAQSTEALAFGWVQHYPGTLYPSDAVVFDSSTALGWNIYGAGGNALVEAIPETFDRQELWLVAVQADRYIGSLFYAAGPAGSRNLPAYPEVKALLRSPVPTPYYALAGFFFRKQGFRLERLKVDAGWSAWYAGALLADKLMGSGTPATAETGQTYTLSGSMTKTANGVQNNGSTATLTANAGAAYTRVGARVVTGASVSPVVLGWRVNSGGTQKYELLLDSGLVQLYKDGSLDSQTGAYGLSASEVHHVWIIHTGSGASGAINIFLYKQRANTYQRIFSLSGSAYGDYAANTYANLQVQGAQGNITASHWEVHE